VCVLLTVQLTLRLCLALRPALGCARAQPGGWQASTERPRDAQRHPRLAGPLSWRTQGR
jgi:hypothetical protein